MEIAQQNLFGYTLGLTSRLVLVRSWTDHKTLAEIYFNCCVANAALNTCNKLGVIETISSIVVFD